MFYGNIKTATTVANTMIAQTKVTVNNLILFVLLIKRSSSFDKSELPGKLCRKITTNYDTKTQGCIATTRADGITTNHLLFCSIP